MVELYDVWLLIVDKSRPVGVGVFSRKPREKFPDCKALSGFSMLLAVPVSTFDGDALKASKAELVEKKVRLTVDAEQLLVDGRRLTVIWL